MAEGLRADVEAAVVVQQPLRAVGWDDLEAVGGEVVGGAGRPLPARVVGDGEVRVLPGAKDARLLSERLNETASRPSGCGG
jgi:hypothetical protein